MGTARHATSMAPIGVLLTADVAGAPGTSCASLGARPQPPSSAGAGKARRFPRCLPSPARHTGKGINLATDPGLWAFLHDVLQGPFGGAFAG